MTPEQSEIIHHPRAAYQRYLDGHDDGITKQQLHDVYLMVARDRAEKELK